MFERSDFIAARLLPVDPAKEAIKNQSDEECRVAKLQEGLKYSKADLAAKLSLANGDIERLKNERDVARNELRAIETELRKEIAFAERVALAKVIECDRLQAKLAALEARDAKMREALEKELRDELLKLLDAEKRSELADELEEIRALYNSLEKMPDGEPSIALDDLSVWFFKRYDKILAALRSPPSASDDAVAREREECAKIAEGEATRENLWHWPRVAGSVWPKIARSHDAVKNCAAVAAAIRARKGA